MYKDNNFFRNHVYLHDMDLKGIKQRFDIIGNNADLNRALDIACQVAPTDLSVLVTGESGVGKEVIPRIIHHNSARKHGHYIAVNCGAIPEGTIDSELFGHEKGAFTGAHEMRKGYFEVANGGTLFLDEVAELPLFTQVRLLRVLETGEFIKVGSSKVQKTDVRVIAATNADVSSAIHKGQFREDLFYRLNTVPIFIPALRQRKEDIYLLFRKFATDFAETYKMPPIKLTPQAQEMLMQYEWPGNIRQLKNVVEQISVIEPQRVIGAEQLALYLPESNPLHLPVPYSERTSGDYLAERDLLYKVLWQLRTEVDQLKEQIRQFSLPKVQSAIGRNLVDTITETEVIDVDDGYSLSPQSPDGHSFLPQAASDGRSVLSQSPDGHSVLSQSPDGFSFLPQAASDRHSVLSQSPDGRSVLPQSPDGFSFLPQPAPDEAKSLEDVEKEVIKKTLQKNRGKRKESAFELGISERTLYRKIKEYKIDN